MKALETWRSPDGSTIVRHEGGLARLKPGQSVAQWEADQAAAHRVQQAQQAAVRQVEEVEAELEGSGCMALLDEATGEVQVFSACKPYYALGADQLAALKAEAAELRRTIDNPQASWVERTRAETRLREVERQIDAAMGERQPWMRGRPGYPPRA